MINEISVIKLEDGEFVCFVGVHVFELIVLICFQHFRCSWQQHAMELFTQANRKVPENKSVTTWKSRILLHVLPTSMTLQSLRITSYEFYLYCHLCNLQHFVSTITPTAIITLHNIPSHDGSIWRKHEHITAFRPRVVAAIHNLLVQNLHHIARLVDDLNKLGGIKPMR